MDSFDAFRIINAVSATLGIIVCNELNVNRGVADTVAVNSARHQLVLPPRADGERGETPPRNETLTKTRQKASD